MKAIKRVLKPEKRKREVIYLTYRPSGKTRARPTPRPVTSCWSRRQVEAARQAAALADRRERESMADIAARTLRGRQ